MRTPDIDNKIELEHSNFDFMKLDMDLNAHLNLVQEAEVFYAMGSYDASMINVRKEAEALADLVLDLEFEVVLPRTTFNEKIEKIRKYVPDKIIELFYQIKREGNLAAHENQGTPEKAEITLRRLRSILLWYLKKVDGVKIDKQPIFKKPVLTKRFKNNQERKLIYIQTADNSTGNWYQYADAHKIGETTAPDDDLEQDWSPNSPFLRESAKPRVSSYMTTAGIPTVIKWSELAWNKSEKTWFGDSQVHEVLRRSNYNNHPLLEGREWFQVDLETAKNAIKAVKEGRTSLNSIETPKEKRIVLRPEQSDAIERTITTFKKHDTMLWNAKMRFGKTLSTYELIKKQKYQRVLVVTHRPIVSDSWFEDFHKIGMADVGYEYVSKTKGESDKILNVNEKSLIYFASIQDLRESKYLGGEIDKNTEVFEENWDLVVIDEAHEGTRTDLATSLFDALIKKQTKVLELSGTPFNILDKYKGKENQVFTWDYVMEQQSKLRFTLEHPDSKNPYESLPEIEMYTFKMGDTNKYFNAGKYFDFSEFFKLNQNGKFIHESAIIKWLDQISSDDSKTLYPFSNSEYRENIRHTLWLLPSVASAKALKIILDKHKIFKEYNVLNIVDNGDAEEVTEKGHDMDRVRATITDQPSQTKSIILTVRKLTTGVNIPELNAVIFLNNTTSAQSYLQAAFRAQTPFTDEVLGMKKKAYIFDFAPDRALNILAQSVAYSPKSETLRTEDKVNKLNELLNFLPVLGQQGNSMKPYSVSTMMRELKKAYAEKAVLSGFDDSSIYNDLLWEVSGDDVAIFNRLEGKLSKTKQSKKTKKVDVNASGLDQEEREKAKRARTKPIKERTTEEIELIEREKQRRRDVQNMIDILRSVSIRIPLMIYGMDIDLDSDVSLDTFVSKIDSVSWKEFMPAGFTKADFNDIKQFFDADVFIEAGHRIRQASISANKLSYQERIGKITAIFSGFKNPDKETVLTPWRVVNVQLGKSLGGFNFYDTEFKEELPNEEIREIQYDNLTDNVFHKNSKILEINSKTGLYPLYVAFSIYLYRYMEESPHWSGAEYVQRDDDLWQEILENNIFVINKTPMARTITLRTLNGYRRNEKFEKNLIYVKDLVNNLVKNPENTYYSILKQFGDEEMKFDAIVGNPPYSESDKDDGKGSSKPLYHHFINLSRGLNPNYISLITPSVWFVGGKGLDKFRESMLNDIHFRSFENYVTSKDVFDNVNIRGGVNFFLWDKNYDNSSHGIKVTDILNNKIVTQGIRDYKIDNLNIFIPDNIGFQLLKQLILKGIIPTDFENSDKVLANYVSTRNPFGLSTSFKDFEKEKSGNKQFKVYKARKEIGYISKDRVKKGIDLAQKIKVVTPFANNISTDLADDNLNTMVIGKDEIVTETYLVIGAEFDLTKYEAENLAKYLQTKFVRYLISLAKANQNGTRQTYRFVPVQNWNNGDIDWSKTTSEIDLQLYEKYSLDKIIIDNIELRIADM